MIQKVQIDEDESVWVGMWSELWSMAKTFGKLKHKKLGNLSLDEFEVDEGLFWLLLVKNKPIVVVRVSLNVSVD